MCQKKLFGRLTSKPQKTAETIGKAVDTIRASGGYVSEIPGHLPHNFIGRFDDRVAHKRRMRALELDDEYLRARKDRGAKLTDASLSISIPLIEAAVDETGMGSRSYGLDCLLMRWIRLDREGSDYRLLRR